VSPSTCISRAVHGCGNNCTTSINKEFVIKKIDIEIFTHSIQDNKE